MNGQMMIQEDAKPFAAYQVRVQLKKCRLSARGLAREIGLKPAAMQRRVSGKVPLTVDEIQAIAEVLGVEPAIFFPPVLPVQDADDQADDDADDRGEDSETDAGRERSKSAHGRTVRRSGRRRPNVTGTGRTS